MKPRLRRDNRPELAVSGAELMSASTSIFQEYPEAGQRARVAGPQQPGASPYLRRPDLPPEDDLLRPFFPVSERLDFLLSREDLRPC